jgi:hypothetical protein
MTNQKINRISSNVILGLSTFAMLLVVGATILVFLGKFNPAPGGDEGTAARLFQLAIVLLMPAGLTFLVTADWHRPKEIAKRLVVPVFALMIAFSTLYYMEYLR